jgi:hypothetical protein
MNKQLAVREEQLFFKLEMKAEQHEATGLKRFLFDWYDRLSDFGESIWLPLRALLVLVAFDAFVLALLQTRVCLVGQGGCSFDLAQGVGVVAYAFADVLPIPGLDKATEGLFKSLYFEGQGALWLAGFGFLSAVVKTSSFVLLFLIGLGLRKQFKFK